MFLNCHYIGGLPDVVTYGLALLGVVSCLVHWRFHALTVDSQPVLIFFAGSLGLLSIGATQYDDPTSTYCDPTSAFQVN